MRYLGVVVSKMTRVDAATVALDIVRQAAARPTCAAPSTLQQQINRLQRRHRRSRRSARRNTVQLTVDANRRQEARARDAIGTAAEILRLYAR